jgi:hypothetical protein
MPNLEDVLKDALVLDAHERAALAEKLLEACRAGRTVLVPAEQVHAKAEKLLR